MLSKILRPSCCILAVLILEGSFWVWPQPMRDDDTMIPALTVLRFLGVIPARFNSFFHFCSSACASLKDTEGQGHTTQGQNQEDYGLADNHEPVFHRICCLAKSHEMFNTLRSRQNGSYFADNIFTSIFLNQNVVISIKISLKFVPMTEGGHHLRKAPNPHPLGLNELTHCGRYKMATISQTARSNAFS